MIKSEYGYTNTYMTKNDMPWFPVMGEFHYSRFRRKYWEESLYKMKSGGVEIVSSYVIWIHHEAKKGEYQFSGNKDLRAFVKTIDKCGMKMILRIGPWCHAEVRNGGFPQWLIDSDIKLRTNDKEYLKVIEQFFGKIYEQIKGLFHKDGGPIIGLQLENELGHAGVGLKGIAARSHMDILMNMIRKIGFDVPIYTATGWGGAIIGDCIPVMGGYCEAPWEKTTDELPPNTNFVITYERDDHNIGTDKPLGDGAVYDINQFPYLTAELGGGLQVTYDRRPVASAEDIGAVSLSKLAGGVNLLGYYMYHGGRNMEPNMHETKKTGSWCDVPEFNYDFQAPIGAYGRISDTYKEIKLLTMFINDFGEELCKMRAYIPQSTPKTPLNLKDLRVSARHNGHSGYVFVNNYQRRYKMAEHNNEVLSVGIANGETITFPAVNIKDKDYFFYPFNFKVGNANIRTATAVPLCKIKGYDDADDTFFFYSDEIPQFDIEGDLADVTIICLSKKDALNAWKIKSDREYIVICDGSLITDRQGVKVSGGRNDYVRIYPCPAIELESYEYTGETDENGFYIFAPKQLNSGCKYPFTEVYFEETECGSEGLHKTYNVTFNYAEGIDDCFINVDFAGNTAKLYVNGEAVDDWFYTGESWTIGLKQFDFPSAVDIEIIPLKHDEKIFLERWPEMESGLACSLKNITVQDEFKRKL